MAQINPKSAKISAKTDSYSADPQKETNQNLKLKTIQ